MPRQVTEVPKFVIGDPKKAQMSVNMNEVVGNNDILFVCLDTLRYDVASQEGKLHLPFSPGYVHRQSAITVKTCSFV